MSSVKGPAAADDMLYLYIPIDVLLRWANMYINLKGRGKKKKERNKSAFL